jgi:hypothetical protein
MYDKYLSSWNNKKRQIAIDYLSKKITTEEAVNSLNSKVVHANSQNINIRVSTPWNELIKHASEYDECQILFKPQGDDTYKISIDGPDNSVLILETAIKKTVNNLLDNAEVGTIEVTNRLMEYLNESLTNSISLRSLVKHLRTIDIGDIMS